MLDKFRNSVDRVAKNMDSWLKDTYIYMQLQQRLPNSITEKIPKRCHVFSARGHSWNDNSQKRKSKKIIINNRFKRELKMTFLLIFYAYQWRLRRQGKMVEQAVIPGNFKRRYRRSPILAYCFTDSLFSRVYSSIDRSSLSSKMFTVVSFNFGPIFFQTEIIIQSQ